MSNSSTSSQKIALTVEKYRFLKLQLRVKAHSNITSLLSGPMLKTESLNLETNNRQLSKSSISKIVSQNIVSQVMEIVQRLAQQDSLTDHKSDINSTGAQLSQAILRHIETLLCQVFHQSSSRIKCYSLSHHKVQLQKTILQ